MFADLLVYWSGIFGSIGQVLVWVIGSLSGFYIVARVVAMMWEALR